MSTSTFAPPPVDDSLSIPQLFDFHSIYSASHPLFAFSSPTGQSETLSWSSVASAIRRNTSRVLRDTPCFEGEFMSSGHTHPVAILAHADSISYMILIVSIMRAGLVPFPISPRCSPAAVQHLLKTTKTVCVYVSGDEAIQSLMNAALIDLPTDRVTVLPMPVSEDLWTDSESSVKGVEDITSASPPDLDGPAVILHSQVQQLIRNQFPSRIEFFCSGAGSRPLHLFAFRSYVPCNGCGVHFASSIHGHDTRCVSARIISQGLYPEDCPSRSAQYLLEPSKFELVDMNLASLHQHWSNDPNALEALAKLHAMIVSGGPLSHDAGERLVDASVRLSLFYAGTEIGCATVFWLDTRIGKDWQYIKFLPGLGTHFIPQDTSDVFELTVLDTPRYGIAVVNKTVDGKPAFATRDLFKRHPSDPTLWKVWGRADEQIMLSSGEKASHLPLSTHYISDMPRAFSQMNPGPIGAEDIFTRNSSRINRAMMFGRGRFNNGIILQLKDEFQFAPSDAKSLQAFRESIRETVNEANTFSPAHSRLFLEVVLIIALGDHVADTVSEHHVIPWVPHLHVLSGEIAIHHEAPHVLSLVLILSSVFGDVDTELGIGWAEEGKFTITGDTISPVAEPVPFGELEVSPLVRHPE
ncbi:hypothetical protein EW146_g6494 [Bondarzewia mesenterica]|uniref:AMP-dependent synthetase/ligase domain-containing protein n=1 Tax=Bondarzewia mesenterica TaxID=1095465 RepID=A0A4V3XEI3_9AGAM|nr:hypothetical protein EW146_g6494 [Bondarzewia mesenterica]